MARKKNNSNTDGKESTVANILEEAFIAAESELADKLEAVVEPEVTVEEVVVEDLKSPATEEVEPQEEPKKKGRPSTPKEVSNGAVVVYESRISGALQPTPGYADDIGWDLYTPVDFVIAPHSSQVVDTGIAIKVPELPDFMKEHFRMATLFWSKSGLSVNAKVEVGAGLTDPGYTGNLVVHLYNHGSRNVPFKAGDKVTQIFFVPALKVDRFEQGSVPSNTERSEKGFGSMG